MYKYSFFNDYSEGAHPNILRALSETNMNQETGYGLDSYSEKAREVIRRICNSNSDIYFVSGGTQVNMLALAHMLRPFESVVAPVTGHINVHEAGAIESTGHKIEAIRVDDGRISPELIDPILKEHADEHMTKPKVVFISNATEVGTTYTKEELKNLSEFCRTNGLYLYVDGARLASALTAEGNDMTMDDLAKYSDMFYVGGTKNGALFGEALVVNNEELKKEMFRNIKQRGALLAKGRVLGIQFIELFNNNLYFDLGRYANTLASKLTTEIKGMGYLFLTESKTNQIFPIFPNELIEKLSQLYGFYVWSTLNENESSIRLVTSWATREDMVDEFLNDLKELSK